MTSYYRYWLDTIFVYKLYNSTLVLPNGINFPACLTSLDHVAFRIAHYLQQESARIVLYSVYSEIEYKVFIVSKCDNPCLSSIIPSKILPYTNSLEFCWTIHFELFELSRGLVCSTCSSYQACLGYCWYHISWYSAYGHFWNTLHEIKVASVAMQPNSHVDAAIQSYNLVLWPTEYNHSQVFVYH